MTEAVRVNQQWPKIKSRHTSTLSPWVDIIAREVEFAPDEPTQTYHALRSRRTAAFRWCGNIDRRSRSLPSNCLLVLQNPARIRR